MPLNKGPWIAYKRPKPIGYAEYEIHHGTDGECVAEVVHGRGNAKLLAAAPELLEALQDLVEAAEEAWGSERPCVAYAMRVISKVKGE